MLEKKIYSDYVDALKSKNKDKTNYLSFIRSELKYYAINSKKDKLDDSEVLTILKKLQKRLFDTKESIPTNNTRQDLLNDLEKELIILNHYLPKLLDDSELLKIIDEVITEIKASSIKDMGKVMKEVLSKVGLKVDSKTLSSLIKDKLVSL